MANRNICIDRRQLLVTAGGQALAIRNRGVSAQSSIWPTSEWSVVDPADVGLSAAQLELTDQRIREAYSDITGIGVIRSGALAFERYYSDEYGKDGAVKIRSITKSVTGTLIGMAIDDGLLALDSQLGDLIPDRIPGNADPITPTITVENLLTMTSGWAWDIGTDYPTLIAADDWAALTLGLPVAYQPGSFYAYNTGGSHLLSVILDAVTGMRTSSFADQRLWSPLGIDRPTWEHSPQGEASGGFGLELTVRELAKVGLLSLRNGAWDGQQLVSPDWFPAATTYKSSGDTTGYAAYGYQWWVIDDGNYHAYFGLGFGSNYLYVVPDLDLIVVVLKGFETPPNPVSIVRPLIEGYILPAVVDSLN